MKVSFILGFQGVGKTHYIQEHYPDAALVDFERYWENKVVGMESFEMATWVKLMAQAQLIYLINKGYPEIVVECTGVTKVNQAGIHAMIVEARIKEYETEIVYLKPVKESAFEETLWDNPQALSMLKDCQRERKNEYTNWRQPTRCPYLGDVTVVEIDHSTWSTANDPEVIGIERI